MNPKFSCADFTFPLLPHHKVLKLLNLLEIEAVDLGIFEDRSHHFPSRVAADPQGEADRMRAQLDANQLQVADVFVQTGPEPPVAAANDPSPEVREGNRGRIRGMIDYCVRLGASHMTGLPGVGHEGVSPDQDWKLAVEEARWRMEEAGSAGITYSIEPHVGSLLPDPESVLRFLSVVPGLTLTLDYGHFLYQGMTNESVHPLIPYASHFHARGGARGMLQSTMKDNAIDYAEIATRLRGNGYDGYLCLEYVWVDWEGCNRTDNISETLLLREMLEKAWVSGIGAAD